MAKLRLVREEKTAKFEPPRRKPNAQSRAREYLTVAEVRKVRDAARSSGRNGLRDGLLDNLKGVARAFVITKALTVMRNEELYNLRIVDIDLNAGLIRYIARAKRKRIPTVALGKFATPSSR